MAKPLVLAAALAGSSLLDIAAAFAICPSGSACGQFAPIGALPPSYALTVPSCDLALPQQVGWSWFGRARGPNRGSVQLRMSGEGSEPGASLDDLIAAAGKKKVTERGGAAQSGEAPGESTGAKATQAPTSEAPAAAAATEGEAVDFLTYVFGKPGELERDLNRLGSSRRRFFTINSAALAFAIAANFLGTTSFLLSLLPGLDGLYLIPAEFTQFYPVKGWKRYKGAGGFEFRYPVEWLQDQAVVMANQRGPQDAELQTMRSARRRAPGTVPAVAFGPRGGDSRENVSVVKSKLREGFSLRGQLGEPTLAAQRLLDNAIAPQGSGKEATLLGALSEQRGAEEVYQFEYVVRLPTGAVLHNVCACVVRDDVLYTLTVLAPEEQWAGKAERLRQVAESFRLV